MRRAIVITLLLGVAGIFGTLGTMYGKASIKTAPPPVVKKKEVTEEVTEAEPEIPEQLLIVHTGDTLDYEPIDEFCLAKNIYHEARSEDLLGQLAVAQVTLNRLESPKYPDTICKVVMQKFQFSWANQKARRWTHPKGSAWEAAKNLANQFLSGGVRVSGLETALYYHADYVSPSWRDPNSMIAQVGAHIFYERAKPL